MMNMTDKEKTDALIELIKIRVDKYKQTRELEFKVNIALWTLIVLIGQYYKSKVSDITTTDLILFIIALILIVAGHYFLWLVPVSESLARDNSKALELQDEVEKITGIKPSIPLRTANAIKTDYRKWNMFLAGITLVLMALLSLFYII
jgi:hypothetical protein